MNTEEYRFAEKICRELISGNRQAMEEVYMKFNRKFLYFTRIRCSNLVFSEPEDFISQFWENLMDGKVICAFLKSSVKSLYTFLLTRLNWRIKDLKKHEAVQKNKQADIYSPNENENDLSDEEKISILAQKENTNQSERLEDITKLIHDCLLELENKSPKDANLIRMKLEGYTYRQMAEYELQGTKDQDLLKKKENAIKKRFTLDRKSSILRFKALIEKNMKKYGLSVQEILNVTN